MKNLKTFFGIYFYLSDKLLLLDMAKKKTPLKFVTFYHGTKKALAVLTLREEAEGKRVYVSYTSVFNEFDVEDLDPNSVGMFAVLARARAFAMENDAILYSY